MFFSKEFVETRRPLLQALEQPAGCVLIDEIEQTPNSKSLLLWKSPATSTCPELGRLSPSRLPDLEERSVISATR